jgi:uncharacterized protein YxeA
MELRVAWYGKFTLVITTIITSIIIVAYQQGKYIFEHCRCDGCNLYIKLTDKSAVSKFENGNICCINTLTVV